jgi:F420-0:gamma-glutamyl ligase
MRFILTDTAGRVVKSGEYQTAIDVSELSTGLYFLTLQNAQRRFQTLRVVVAR